MTDEVKTPASTEQTIEIPKSGDELIDKFAALDDVVPSKTIHDTIKGLTEKGGDKDDDSEVQGKEGEEEITPSDSEGAEEESGSNEPSDKIPPKKDSAPPESSVKIITAKNGDKELQVPENVVFTVKVDGKEAQASMADLIRNYQGKVPWEKHYQQLKSDRTKFDTDVKALDTKLREIIELTTTDPFKALERVVVLSGKNPGDYLETYLAQAKKTAEDIANMSEEEIKNWIGTKRAQYESERVKNERMQLDAEKAATQVDKFFVESQAEYSITDEELTTAWEIAKSPENQRLLANKSPMDVAKLVVDYIIKVDRPYRLIENTVAEVSPELRQNGDFIRELKNHFSTSPDFTADDIKIVVKGYLGESEKASLNGSSTPSKDSIRERQAKAPLELSQPTSQKIPQKKQEKTKGGLEDFDPIRPEDLDELTKFF